MSILTRNDVMSDNAVIYRRPGIIDNHQLSCIKVPPIIDNEMIADSHHCSFVVVEWSAIDPCQLYD